MASNYSADFFGDTPPSPLEALRAMVPSRRILKQVVADPDVCEFVPSDDADVTTPAGDTTGGAMVFPLVRAFRVETSGDVKVTFVDGAVGVIPAVSGLVEHVAIKRVWENGTTAAGIVLYL